MHEKQSVSMDKVSDGSEYTRAEYTPYLIVIVTLYPGHQGEEGEQLRLDLQRYIEAFDNIIYTEWYSSPCPKHHHGRLETCGTVSSIVDDYLRNELAVPDQCMPMGLRQLWILNLT